MKSPLHILHLEDDLADALLIKSTLEREGIATAITLVQSRAGFIEALQDESLDLILSDYSLPQFDGLSAVEIVRERRPELPVILVSGSLGEERAIDALKSGAIDYVLKERLGRLVPAVRRAMTEVKERAGRQFLEKQVIEAQKMEVIGRLAAGVAHDFNNLLMVIMGYGNMLTAELEADDPLYKYAQEIQHASERAAGLTRQLLVFSRKQTVQPVVLDLNAVVKEMDEMLRRLVGEHIEMTMQCGADAGCISADAGYIGQVLMNLVVNARDAMPNGGRISIATSLVTLDDAAAQALALSTPGRYVQLTLSDTGIGIADDVKAHIFEAFFTTKSSNKGTGLGLSTCQTIIHQSGGQILVESDVGKGTTFKIYFAQVAAVGAQVVGPKPKAPHSSGGTETLLLVEDEPSVRHLACGVLEGLGYKVLSASNGQEALHVVREHQGAPIRLVVTDVIMPQMGGKIMADWLKTSYPDLKILFTSGYTDDAISQHGVVDAGVEFLAKPYAPALLARRVRELLDRGTP
jgi:signal transduction histidine kinase